MLSYGRTSAVWGTARHLAVMEPSSRPNFLVILADDLAWSDVGCFGGEISTPNIDQLGYNGLRLTDFHTSALCSPTRSMLMTGTDHHLTGLGGLAEFIIRSPSHIGKPGHEGHLNDNVATFPQHLQDAGYWTCMSGKWHLGLKKEQSPWAKGFDKSFAMLPGCCNHYAYEPPLESEQEIPPFFSTNTTPYHREDEHIVKELPADYYSSDFYADKLIEFLRSHHSESPDQPFFAYLPFTAVHWPLQAPKENCDHYLGRYNAGPHALRLERVARQKAMGLIQGETVSHPIIAPEVSRWEDMTAEGRARSCRTMEVYAGMTERMDENIGKVVEYLKTSGQYENTYIIFMSDNGKTRESSGKWQSLTAKGAEGAAVEASPTMNGATLEHMQKYYDNSLDNIGRATSYCWYGPIWAQAATAPSRLYKWFSTEGGVRVPFILSKPGLARPAGIEDAFCTVMDIGPTILDLAGAEALNGIFRGRKVEPARGKSWRNWLSSKSEKDIHDLDYTVGWELGGCGALRKGHWKVNWVPPPKGPGKWQLYNLASDRSEMNDLAGQFPERLEELVDLWKKYAKDVGVVGLRNETAPLLKAAEVEESNEITWLRFMDHDGEYHQKTTDSR